MFEVGWLVCWLVCWVDLLVGVFNVVYVGVGFIYVWVVV